MPRDDYKELMELCLLILGESQMDRSIYRFRQAGAYHMARWMAKVIYSFKICSETSFISPGIAQSSASLQVMSMSSWITCPVTCDAPINDVQLLKISNVIQLSKCVLLQP